MRSNYFVDREAIGWPSRTAQVCVPLRIFGITPSKSNIYLFIYISCNVASPTLPHVGGWLVTLSFSWNVGRNVEPLENVWVAPWDWLCLAIDFVLADMHVNERLAGDSIRYLGALPHR